MAKTVAVGGASILALGGLAAIAPLAAVGAGALFVGYLGRNYLYDYADRLNAGQTDAQAIQGSLIGNTPALGGLYRGLTNTDPGTGESLNLSNFEQGNQLGSGLAEAALLYKGPRLYRVGNATARATSEVVSALRAHAAYYGPESAGVPAAASVLSSNLPRSVFHYTDETTAALIERSQLGLPGRTTYLTPNGQLSPLQAQIELALPQKNTAKALFEVSTEGLDHSKVLLQQRVPGNVFNRAGGGTEIL